MRNFHFDIDVEVFEKAGAEGRERRIGGIVSTDHLDKDSEVILQEGLDFSPFLKSGWFNDNHSQDTDAILGYPERAELRTLPDGRKGWYVEGYLLKGYDRADRVWELAKALQKSDRRLGFSVEGAILQRDPDDPLLVRKATVREVAITRCPVNDKTSLTLLAKSLSVGHTGAVANTQVPGDAAPLTMTALEGVEPGRPGKKKKRKRYTKSEAVSRLRALRPDVSPEMAGVIVDYAMQLRS